MCSRVQRTCKARRYDNADSAFIGIERTDRQVAGKYYSGRRTWERRKLCVFRADNYFHKEKKKKNRENIYRMVPYDEKTNTYTCPAGKKLNYYRTKRTRSDNNYLKTEELYRCEDCTFCAQVASCKKIEQNRQIRVSHPLKKYRLQANENLCSETGKRLRSQRVVEVEQTFGRLKGCWGFR